MVNDNAMKNNKPQIIHLEARELDEIKSRLLSVELAENDKKIILSILTTYQWLYQQLQTAKFTLHRLKKMFGFKTERRPWLKNKTGAQESLSTLEQIRNDLETSNTLLTDNKEALTKKP